MQGERVELLHLKNGLFQGRVGALGRKEGEAICLYDNGGVLCGKFKDDMLEGEAIIFLTPDTYFMGGLKRGMIDGPLVLRSPMLHVYATINMNKIAGEIVVVDLHARRARVWEVENGEGRCIRQADFETNHDKNNIIKTIAPHTQTFPNLLEHFILNINNKFSIKTAQGRDRLEVGIEAKTQRRLSVHFDKERIMATGVWEGGSLQGLGYLYDAPREVEWQGEMENGELHGEGVKREIGTGRTIYGRFSRGDIRSLDIMTDKSDMIQGHLLKLKKRVHIHSLQYRNDYINERPVLLLHNFLDMVVENEASYNRYVREHSRPQLLQNSTTSRQSSQGIELGTSIREYNLLQNQLKRRL